ncbi:MAG: LuxR C-terminal-related transcriptional regulator [Micropepsaceae bacterium]
MLNNLDVHIQFGTALRTLTSELDNASLWASVKSAASTLGCSYVSAVNVRKLADGADTAVYYSDLPTEIFPKLEKEDLILDHPIVKRSFASPEPFTISSLRAQSEPVDKRWVELLHQTVAGGDALIIPVHDRKELEAIFVFGGERPDFSPLTRAMLQVLAYAAISARLVAEKRGAQASDYGLTLRELQCLRVVAQGRIDPDIGQMFSISARTVRFHVDNAKRKLGVDTRLQAIAKAMREKIFEI